MESSVKHYVSSCSPNVRDICLPLRDFFDFRMFSYYNLLHNGTMSAVSTNYLFLEHYFNNKHYFYDPHIVAPKNIMPGIAIWSSCDDVYYQGRLLYDAARLFHIGDGVSFVRQHNAGCHIFSFAVASGTSNLNNYLFNNSSLLEKFIDYFMDVAVDSIAAANDKPIEIAKLKGEKFYQQEGITNAVVDLSMEGNYAKDYSL